MGSPKSIKIETECFRVIEAWFPPETILDPHTHDRAIFAIMLQGGFRTEIGNSALDCEAGYAWTEPNSEIHANYVGREGAHVVVIQPDDSKRELVEPLDALLLNVCRLRHPALLCAAYRMRLELRSLDVTSSLVIESSAASALATAAGLGDLLRGSGRVGWVERVRELLHDEWRDAPSLGYAARVAGVHPCHLAHTFRERFGESMGSYVKRLRVTWALGQLIASGRPISQIALDAGFFDQSHFTRQCQRLTGRTPGAYRASGRERRQRPLRDLPATILH